MYGSNHLAANIICKGWGISPRVLNQFLKACIQINTWHNHEIETKHTHTHEGQHWNNINPGRIYKVWQPTSNEKNRRSWSGQWRQNNISSQCVLLSSKNKDKNKDITPSKKKATWDLHLYRFVAEHHGYLVPWPCWPRAACRRRTRSVKLGGNQLTLPPSSSGSKSCAEPMDPVGKWLGHGVKLQLFTTSWLGYCDYENHNWKFLVSEVGWEPVNTFGSWRWRTPPKEISYESWRSTGPHRPMHPNDPKGKQKKTSVMAHQAFVG